MVTAAGRKVLQKAIFSFWERIPRRKTGELQKILCERRLHPWSAHEWLLQGLHT